jgi:hypothetical protein
MWQVKDALYMNVPVAVAVVVWVAGTAGILKLAVIGYKEATTQFDRDVASLCGFFSWFIALILTIGTSLILSRFTGS